MADPLRRQTTVASKLRRMVRSNPWLYSALGPLNRAMMLGPEWLTCRTYRYRPQDPPSTVSPRFVLDGCAFQESRGGIPRLWTRILQEWSASGFGAHVTVLDRDGTAPRVPGVRYLPVPRLRLHHTASQRAMLERICRDEHADLFVSTWYTTPTTCPSLLYVYDMTPELLGFDLREPLWRDKRVAIERALALVSLSQATRDELIRLYPRVAHVADDIALPGVDPVFIPAKRSEIDSLSARIDMSPGYFMFMGNRDSYKNAELLRQAWPLVSEAVRTRGMLFVGGAPALEQPFARAFEGVRHQVVSLTDEELRAAYSSASALLYLSRSEGFGLPIVEAMACGCPVVAGSSPVLIEAAGGAGLAVDDRDPRALAAAIEAITDPALRDELTERGMAWVETLTWRSTADKLAAAMYRVAQPARD